MTGHAILGASSAKRWMNCPGSPNFILMQPESHLDNSSEYADEGTEAHALAETCLINGYKAMDQTDNPLLAEAIQEYLDTVWGVYDELLNPVLFIEHRFKISEKLWGTNDALIWDDITGSLYVFDYKHGAGVYVDVTENVQLSYYALGAITSLNIKPNKIVQVIVQPRCDFASDRSRTWELPEGYIEEFKTKLFEAAARTEEKDAPLAAGSHCQFCPAIAVCPAYKSLILESANHTLLAENYKLSEYLGKWQAALARVVYKAMFVGESVPGFKLVEKNSHRKWKDPIGLAKSLKDNDKVFKPRELKSPAQVEKIISKDFVSEHSFKPKGDLTVALESDKRPAWTKAQHDFADVESEAEK